MSSGGEPPLRVWIDPKEWARLKHDLDQFEPTLARALRRRIREAGSDAVSAVKSAVLEAPPTGGSYNVGARSDIARATRISTSFSKTGAGVKIITGGVRNGFSKAYNMGTFRHPVFGGSANKYQNKSGNVQQGSTNAWVTQEGRPYFGSVITKSMRVELVSKVRKALDEAVTAIGGKGL